MMFDPETHNRKSIRLKGYDYSSPGAYFVTICTYKWRCSLGEIENCKMLLNSMGQIVKECWEKLPKQYSYISLDEWVVMPNHFHGILVINDNNKGGSRTAPTKHKTLGSLIGAFKTISTKRVNVALGKSKYPLWQRNYYEHVIRDNDDLYNVQKYIVENPIRWEHDKENPVNIA